MCVRYLGFVLLVWFPVVLHAQSAAQSCRAPRLNGGYLVPEKEAYFHGMTLSYGCDDGLKPAVEGWWATSTCQNGSWSHEPQCIDEKACLPPHIPNAKYTASQNGWYKDEHKVRITCDVGYEPKDRQVTTKCINGTWSSVPVCEKSSDSCGEPPKVPHAVIIHQRHQEVYPVDTKLQYECEDGYSVEGADTTKLIFCFSGNWTEGPTCKAHCTLDPAQYVRYSIQVSGATYLKEGEQKYFPCVWRDYSSHFQCTNGRITFTRCCHTYDRQRGVCR
ncbi:complement factor H-related protein 1-like [Epinephelus fuscoguttatus]|uniref:complement factor H-related protein 1-like n=1 Tax=Epinephelus fuscoguttatus TaxID=293821 RepID=UPI0020D1720D|nr:complement factor H-related protein 1-like [Epinephelus fuscoguttatus]